MRRVIGVLVSALAVMIASAACWPVDHGDPLRSGWLPSQDHFSALHTRFADHLDGAVYASPILTGNQLIVATENDTVYALDPQTGAVKWRNHLAAPISDTRQLACSGNISPSGITGTPVWDVATNRVFVAILTNTAARGVHHEVVALNGNTGRTEFSRYVNVPGGADNAEQQRGALALDGNHVLIPFGGLAGDCGQYKGAVVSLRTDNSSLSSFVTPTSREGAIWAPGGPVVLGDGTYLVAIGNGASSSGFDGSDSVTRVRTADSKRIDYFAPSSWANDNRNDLDLGSMTPAVTKAGFTLQAGKSGTGYVMRTGRLGIGGQTYAAPLCTAFGVSAATGQTVFVPCTNGVTRVVVNRNGTFTKSWTLPSDGGHAVNGSPVVGNGVIFSVASGRLYAANASGGLIGSVGVGSTNRFTTPALDASSVYVGTNTGVVAVSVG